MLGSEQTKHLRVAFVGEPRPLARRHGPPKWSSGTDRTGGTRGERRGPERAGLVDGRDLETVEAGGLGAHDFCAVPPSAGDDDAHRRPDDVVHHPVQRQRLVGGGGDHGFPHFTRPDPAGDAAERKRIGAEPAHRYPALGRLLGGGVEPGQPVGSHAEQLERARFAPGRPRCRRAGSSGRARCSGRW